MSYERVSFWNRVLQHPAALLVKETPEYFQSWSSSSFTHAHNFVIILWLYLYLFWNLSSFNNHFLIIFFMGIIILFYQYNCRAYYLFCLSDSSWCKGNLDEDERVSLFSSALIGRVMEQYLHGTTKVFYLPQLTSEDSPILEMLR